MTGSSESGAVVSAVGMNCRYTFRVPRCPGVQSVRAVAELFGPSSTASRPECVSGNAQCTIFGSIMFSSLQIVAAVGGFETLVYGSGKSEMPSPRTASASTPASCAGWGP